MEHDTRGVHISAGDGIVAHAGNLTAFATGDESRLNELLVRLNALTGEPWTEIVRSITSGITDVGFDDHPSLACVAVEEDKIAAFVFGETSLSVSIDGAETLLDGRDSSTWIDVALRGTIGRVHAGQQSDSAVVGVLRDGVVPAGGFLLDTGGPIPAAGRWSEVVSAPVEQAAPEDAPEPVVDQSPELGVPVVEDVVAHAPIAEEPVVEAPVAQAPIAEEPVVETPVAQAPIAEEAEVEQAQAPVAEPAVEEAPAEESAESATQSPSAQRSMFTRIEELGRVAPAAFAADDNDSAQRFTESPFTQNAIPANPNEAAESPAANENVAPATPQRPQLKGVLCASGHLTAPLESSCRSCGEAVPDGAEAATQDRPTLGTLRFDDGAVLNIDRPAVIGASVPPGYLVDSEPATIVRLDDGVGGVSDIHLEVRLSGWNVEIVDMNSETGTYTLLGGERQTRTKLRAGQSVLLARGMAVEAGGRSFVYSVETTVDA